MTDDNWHYYSEQGIIVECFLFIVCIYFQCLPTIEGETTYVIGGPMFRMSLNYCSCSRSVLCESCRGNRISRRKIEIRSHSYEINIDCRA